jgi:hypothetical protein
MWLSHCIMQVPSVQLRVGTWSAGVTCEMREIAKMTPSRLTSKIGRLINRNQEPEQFRQSQRPVDAV